MSIDPTATPSPEMVRHEERIDVGVARVPYRRVQVRRRIVTEVRQIRVEVRTEVLDIDWHDIDEHDIEGHDIDGHAVAGERVDAPDHLEIVLHGEEPEVRLVNLAKERVVVRRVVVPGTTDIETAVRAERVVIEPGADLPAR